MSKEATARSAMKLALEHAKRDERHLNHAETRYWCRMYRDIAEKAVEALAKPDFWEGYVSEPVSEGRALKLAMAEANDKRLEAQQEPVAWTNWRELAGARHYRTPGWEMYADKRNPDDVALYTSPPAQPVQDNPLDCGVYLGSGKDHEIKHHVSYGPEQPMPDAFEQLRREADKPAQQEYASFAEWAHDYVQDNLHKLKPAQQALDKMAENARELGLDYEPVQQKPAFLDWYDNAHLGNEDFKEGCWRAWDAALAQRKPLTDEQIIKCWGQVSGTRHGYVAFARAIEAAHGIKENT